MKNLNNYDWYCDECNDLLNTQSGFNTSCGTWSCKKCEEVNYIDESEILDDYQMLIQSMYLTKHIAEKKSKDLSKVEYSPIVKKLYKYNGQI